MHALMWVCVVTVSVGYYTVLQCTVSTTSSIRPAPAYEPAPLLLRRLRSTNRHGTHMLTQAKAMTVYFSAATAADVRFPRLWGRATQNKR